MYNTIRFKFHCGISTILLLQKMDCQAVFIATILNLTCRFTTAHVIWQSIKTYTANRWPCIFEITKLLHALQNWNSLNTYILTNAIYIICRCKFNANLVFKYYLKGLCVVVSMQNNGTQNIVDSNWGIFMAVNMMSKILFLSVASQFISTISTFGNLKVGTSSLTHYFLQISFTKSR